MSKQIQRSILFLMLFALLIAIASPCAFAIDHDFGQSELLSEEQDYDCFDSPLMDMNETEASSNSEFMVRSSDAAPNASERLNSVSSASIDDSGEEDPVFEDALEIPGFRADGEEGASLMDAPFLSLSTSTLCFAKGSYKTIYLTIYNFYDYGSIHFQWGSSNKSVCTLNEASLDGNRLVLVLEGKDVGDCYLAFRIVRDDTVIATSEKLEVSVLPAVNPRIMVSGSSLTITKGQRATVTVSHNLTGANVYVGWEWPNNGVIDCNHWSNWNASRDSFYLYVDGKSVGSVTMRLCLYNRFNEALAYTYISPVEVNDVLNPSLSLSTTRVEMYTGETARVRVTVTGMSGVWYLCLERPNVCTAQWKQISDTVFDLYLSSNTPVSSSVKVSIQDANRHQLKAESISLKITKKLEPRLEASRTSITMSAGSQEYLAFAVYDCNESVYLHMETSPKDAFHATWGRRNGDVVSCSIVAYSYDDSVIPTLKVQLCRADHTVLDEITIQIKIVAGSRPPMTYAFTNFATQVPLSTYQIIYGNGMRAKSLYNKNHGVTALCFGMSTSSAMIYHGKGGLGLQYFEGSPNTVYNLTYDLTKNNPVNRLVNLSLRQIIEAFHVSQDTSMYTRINGVSAVAKKIVSEIDSGRSITVGMRGDYLNDQDVGHRVVAYRYTYPTPYEMLVNVYDPNYTTTGTLSFQRDSDSGNYTSWYFSNLDWGTGKPNASINCITLDSLEFVWSVRGSRLLQLFEEEEEPERQNLFITSEKSFELYAMDTADPLSDGILKIRCESGIVKYLDENVTYIDSDGILPDGTVIQNDMVFYLPIDYYTFRDLSPEDGAVAVLSDDSYSVTVSTDAQSFDFFAEDATSTVGASLYAANGDAYQVTIGSSIEDEPDQYSYSGIGQGRFISLILEEGQLSAAGMNGASVSISTDEPDCVYSIYADHTDGGAVLFEDGKGIDLPADDSCLMHFVPDDGYKVYNVSIDGQDYGSISSFTFTDIDDNHSVFVDFRQDIATCDVQLAGYDSFGKPMFILVNAHGEQLVADQDYQFSHLAEEEDEFVFLAGKDSAYYGVLDFHLNDISQRILSCFIDQEQIVTVSLSSAVADSKVLVALYDQYLQLLDVKEVIIQDKNVSLDLSSVSFPDVYHLSIFWLDQQCRPICAKASVN